MPKPGCFSNGILNHSATDSSPSCNLVHAPIALSVLANFISDDPQHRQFADRELARECRWHRTGRGEVSAAGNRDWALSCPLKPPGREERGSSEWDAHRLDLPAPADAPAGVQALGQSLGIIVGHSTSREARLCCKVRF